MNSIDHQVTKYFVEAGFNCAATTLLILSKEFSIPLNEQIIIAATGLNGAGRFQAQCGLVEGTLMFLGILGEKQGWTKDEIVNVCYHYAETFTEEFGSLSCRELRPEGFKPENPPYLCESLAKLTVKFGVKYVKEMLKYNE